MTLAGLTLPALSEYDPPVAGEGSLDPMGSRRGSRIASPTSSSPGCAHRMLSGPLRDSNGGRGDGVRNAHG